MIRKVKPSIGEVQASRLEGLKFFYLWQASLQSITWPLGLRAHRLSRCDVQQG
jgi:hypothetical protein